MEAIEIIDNRTEGEETLLPIRCSAFIRCKQISAISISRTSNNSREAIPVDSACFNRSRLALYASARR